MKSLILALLVIIPGTVWAQPATDESPLAPLAGFGRYRFNGNAEFGPTVGLHLAFLTHRQFTFGFNAGVGFRLSSSQPGEAVPLLAARARAGFADTQPVPDDYAAYSGTRSPRVSLALGFLGPDVTMYFGQGDVRPYAAVGAQLILFPYSDHVAGAVAPDVRAGLDVELTSGLSGFVEVRHAFGIANLVSPSGKDFRDISIFAFGLSFAPSFD